MDGIDSWEELGNGLLRKHCIVTLLASINDLLEQYYGRNLISQTFPEKVPNLVEDRVDLNVIFSAALAQPY
jgi:hypothetical protein